MPFTVSPSCRTALSCILLGSAVVDVGMSWRCRAKQEGVRVGSAVSSGCSRRPPCPALPPQGYQCCVHCPLPWVLQWGWGAFRGLSCFPATSWIFCMAGVATTELLAARSNLQLRWFPVLALQRLVHTRAGFLHP